MLKALTETLTKNGYEVRSNQVPLFEGSTDRCDKIDSRATAATHKDGKEFGDVQTLLMKALSGEGGHKANVASTRDAAGDMAKACRGDY